MNGDHGTDIVNPGDQNDNKDYKYDGQGVGSIGLHLKTRLLKTRYR